MRKYVIMGVVICWIIGVIQMMTPAQPPPYVEDTMEVAFKVAPPTPVATPTPTAPLIVAYKDSEGTEPVVDNIIPSRSVSAMEYTRKDVILLATLIFGEAGDQSYDGKLAVGTVVLNRLAVHFRGGDTLREVIYSRGQFDAVHSNWHSPSKDSLRAAESVLEGYRSFEESILYYYNPRLSTDTAFTSSVDMVYVIGDHVFCRDFIP